MVIYLFIHFENCARKTFHINILFLRSLFMHTLAKMAQVN